MCLTLCFRECLTRRLRLSGGFTDSYIRKEEMQDTVWAQKNGDAFFVCVAHWQVRNSDWSKQQMMVWSRADSSHTRLLQCVSRRWKNTFYLMKKVQANYLVASFWKIIHFNLFNIMWCYSGALSNTLLNLYEEGKNLNTVWHVILKYLTNDVRLSFCV